jgi:ribonuclease HIII
MKLEKEKVEKLIEVLKKKGAVEEKPPENVSYRLRKGNGILMVYDTGSIVYSGRERKRLKEEVIEEILRLEETPRIGCDEAGKGEFFGPLVVSCICADRECLRELLKSGVKDSKKIPKERIPEIAEKIKRSCKGAVRVLKPEKYNEEYRKFGNVNRLLENIYMDLIGKLLKRCSPRKVVIDKFSPNVEKVVRKAFPEINVEAKPCGEDDVVVAAASIVAKNERLRVMSELSKELGFALPEGNVKNREILSKIPKEKRLKFVKEHFKIGE